MAINWRTKIADIAYKSSEKQPKIFTGGALTPPKFSPSFFEWLSVRGKLISGFKSIENAEEVLYTVPTGKIFFLLGISLASANDALLLSLPTLDLRIDSIPIATVSCGKLDGANGNMAMSFSIPITIRTTQKLIIESNRADCWLRGTYLGYEIDEKDVPIL